MAHDETPLDEDEGTGALTPEQERDRRIARLVLLRRALDPEEAAFFRRVFHEILRTHLDDVWAYLRHNVAPASAEDLLQEVFCVFYARVLKEGFPDRIGTTLFVIARGKLANERRDARREPVSIGLPSSEPPRTPPDLARALDLATMRQILLSRLSDEHRAVIELCILRDVGDEEAAEMLGLKLGTLKSRVAAAKRRLAELAAELIPPGERAA